MRNSVQRAGALLRAASGGSPLPVELEVSEVTDVSCDRCECVRAAEGEERSAPTRHAHDRVVLTSRVDCFAYLLSRTKRRRGRRTEASLPAKNGRRKFMNPYRIVLILNFTPRRWARRRPPRPPAPTGRLSPRLLHIPRAARLHQRACADTTAVEPSAATSTPLNTHSFMRVMPNMHPGPCAVAPCVVTISNCSRSDPRRSPPSSASPLASPPHARARLLTQTR